MDPSPRALRVDVVAIYMIIVMGEMDLGIM